MTDMTEMGIWQDLVRIWGEVRSLTASYVADVNIDMFS